jgi:hypothetical protein
MLVAFAAATHKRTAMPRTITLVKDFKTVSLREGWVSFSTPWAPLKPIQYEVWKVAVKGNLGASGGKARR